MYDIIDLLIVSRPYTQNRRHKPHSANFTQYTSQTFVSHHVSITTFCIHVRVYICHSYTIVVHNIEISCFRGRFPNDASKFCICFTYFYTILHTFTRFTWEHRTHCTNPGHNKLAVATLHGVPEIPAQDSWSHQGIIYSPRPREFLHHCLTKREAIYSSFQTLNSK